MSKSDIDEGQKYFDLDEEVERFRRSGSFKKAEAARRAREAKEAN